MRIKLEEHVIFVCDLRVFARCLFFFVCIFVYRVESETERELMRLGADLGDDGSSLTNIPL